MKVSFNWLKDYVGVKGSHQGVAQTLTMAGLEVEKVVPVGDDFIFQTEITTNRPDWLSHLGVAREVYAVGGGRFTVPKQTTKARSRTARHFKISVKAPNLCPYYSATYLEGVEAGSTPEFIRKRLGACGIRSINLCVDVTNYVLLEWGQPLHVFDADRLNGNIIYARRAESSERMVALDDVTYDLTKDDLVIADAKGPIAIGGVMGGKGSEVTHQTKNILLESAFFAPFSVRSTSRRLQLVSESSYRFERRVDPKGVDYARDRAIDLVCKYGKVKCVSTVFRGGKAPIREPKISLKRQELKQILGLDIPMTTVKGYLKRLGLHVTGGASSVTVKVPSFRGDLTRSIDLIEEVARLYGYDRIPETLPRMLPRDPGVDSMLALEDRVRDLSTGLGLQEVVTFSLVEPEPFKKLKLSRPNWTRLVNPQNKELNLMRPNLLSGLLNTIRHNLHVGESDLRLFEIGNRYLSPSRGRFPTEERLFAIALAGEGNLNWLVRKRSATFYDLKGMVEELLSRLAVSGVQVKQVSEGLFETGQGVELSYQGKIVGQYGTLASRVREVYDVKRPVFFAELNLEEIAALVVPRPSVKRISKFPASPRDLTLVLPEAVRSAAIVSQIRSCGGDLVQDIDIFDFFKGNKLPKGKKSLSFRISYQSGERTLQNEEVNQLHFSVIDTLRSKFSAELPEG